MKNKGKVLIITDVHAKIKEMNDFFTYLIDEKKEDIQFAIHMGDFWSGRNYEGGGQVRLHFDVDNREIFENFRIPIFHLKGNEDLEISNEYWLSSKSWLMNDQEPFYLGNYKVLPLYYHEKGTEGDKKLKHPEFSEKDNFDFIFSHRPPQGILDNTLHAKTHEILRNIGSPMVRSYYENIKPSILFFGHNHYSNFVITDYGLVVSIDKLVRTSKKTKKPKYSYALIDPFYQTLEVVWKNREFFNYSILENKITYLQDLDKRKLY